MNSYKKVIKSCPLALYQLELSSKRKPVRYRGARLSQWVAGIKHTSQQQLLSCLINSVGIMAKPTLQIKLTIASIT